MAQPGRALKWSGASDHVLKASFHDVFLQGFVCCEVTRSLGNKFWTRAGGFSTFPRDFGQFPDVRHFVCTFCTMYYLDLGRKVFPI